jgi:hypothetical protein
MGLRHFPRNFRRFQPFFRLICASEGSALALCAGFGGYCLTPAGNATLFCASFPENDIDKTLTMRYTCHSEIVK